MALVDSKGRTLYMLTADSRMKGKGPWKDQSVCHAACLKAWPPLLTTGLPRAGKGVTAALLGVAARADGTWQVTYAGHRLYLFYKDTAAGQANGQKLKGFGGPFCTASLATKPCVWYALSPSGAPITSAAAAAKAPAPTKKAAPGAASASLAAGETIFKEKCGTCHTLAAANTHGGVGPNLDQLKPSQATVASQVKSGGTFMPSFATVLSSAQIKEVAAFVYHATHA